MLALLFPGQGSQRVGMGRDAWEAAPEARSVFEAADAALGLPLSRLCFEGPAEELVRTEIQQPAILTVSLALLRALEARGPVAPALVAGHSLGEYTALVASGALGLEDAVRLVHQRGRFMQEAVPEGRGAMAAVLGASTQVVDAACESVRERTGQIVTAANYNAPQQTVIAGTADAVEAASAEAREAGARRVVKLSVSVPFHCPLMAPAAEKLAPELARVRFGDPKPPLVSTMNAEVVAEAGRLPPLLERQVTAPVRFTAAVEKLVSSGITRILEVGPGQVLTGLVAKTARGLACANLDSMESLTAATAFAAGQKAAEAS